MSILEAFQSFFVAVILGYLSITNTVALKVGAFINAPLHAHISAGVVNVSERSVPSEALVILSRSLASTDAMPQVLKGDPAFQSAFKNQEAALGRSIDDSIIDKDIVASLVNILCEYRTDEYIRTTTGTGFLIGGNGVILTNAHVAQFLLLKDLTESIKDARCVIRSGDPAVSRFQAELLFLSPTWVLNNAELITAEKPVGTGEYDYALLYITKSIDGTPLPESFPSLPFSTEFLSKKLMGTSVRSAGYPAEKILTEGARAELEPHVAETTIQDLYTFGSNYADIISLSPSEVGEQGASGGPVVDEESGVIGLIVTKGKTESEYTKSLRALTLSYIDRTISEETGFSLAENIGGDLSYRSKVFHEALFPFLSQLISFEL